RSSTRFTYDSRNGNLSGRDFLSVLLPQDILLDVSSRSRWKRLDDLKSFWHFLNRQTLTCQIFLDLIESQGRFPRCRHQIAASSFTHDFIRHSYYGYLVNRFVRREK